MTTEEFISKDRCTQELHPSVVTYRDYNFKKPALNYQAAADADVDTHLEVYDYLCNYDDPDQGES